MGARESDPSSLALVLQGKAAAIGASNAARTFGEAQWLTNDECARLCIIIEEVIANLFEHAGLSESDEVELSLTSEPRGIRIVIVDSGRPFDPRAAPRSTAVPGRGGGAGIDIVRAWVEFVDYSTSFCRNRLEMFLPLGTQAEC